MVYWGCITKCQKKAPLPTAYIRVLGLHFHATFLQRDVISRLVFIFNFCLVCILYLAKSRANHANRHHLGTFFKKCMVAGDAKKVRIKFILLTTILLKPMRLYQRRE